MDVKSVMVVGANRGIGLEFVRQFVALTKPPRYVFATYRSENSIEELEKLKNASEACRVILVKMDVMLDQDVDSCRRAVEDTVGEDGLTVLVNNAGVLRMQGWPDVTDDNIIFHINTNAIGPIRVLRAMFPLLKKASKSSKGQSKMSFSRSGVVNISSDAGSILKSIDQQPGFEDNMAYRISKATLNMAMRVVAASTKDDGVLVVQVHPGWVRTDMGTDAAGLDVTDSVSDMFRTMATLDESHHGAFMDRLGSILPF